MYRDEIYSLQIQLSRTQAGPGRTVKQEQEEISPNHVQRLNLISVELRDQLGPSRTVKQEQEEISPNHVQRINLPSVETGNEISQLKF